MTTLIADIPASSIPAARTYIHDGLQVQLAGAQNLLVCYDEPGPYQPDDIIVVGEVHQTYSPEQTVGSGGRLWLREDYTVSVIISVYRGGDDPAAVFARGRQLADLVVAVVRADPSLGGAVDRARPSTVSHVSAWNEEHSGRVCDIDIGIDCMNTI